MSQSIANNHSAISYTGLGTGLTGIPRSGLVAGTPSQVIINDGFGVMISAAQLTPALGGTGISTASSTGVAKVTAGTWSVAGLIDADVASGAAITRNKLAAGTASHVVINNGSGVMTSEAQLAPIRGGTGLDLSGVAGPAVLGVTSGVTSAVGYSQLVSANSIVQRDAGGNIAASGLTTAGALLITGTPLTLGDFNHSTGTGNVGSYAASTTTVGAVTNNIFTMVTATNTTYSIRVMIAAGDQGLTGSLLFTYSGKVKNINGVLTIDVLFNNWSIKDAGLTDTTSILNSSGSTLQVTVTGVAAKTIRWSGEIVIVSQTF